MVCIHILGGWKAVYHAKREHQRLKGEVDKAAELSGWRHECVSMLELKCKLKMKADRKSPVWQTVRGGEGLGAF